MIKILQEIVFDITGQKVKLTDESSLDEFRLDSLESSEMLIHIEEHFNVEITDEEAIEWQTVQDIIDTIKAKS